MLRHPPKVSAESATLGNSTFHLEGPGVRGVVRGVELIAGGLPGCTMRAGGMLVQSRLLAPLAANQMHRQKLQFSQIWSSVSVAMALG